MPTLIAGIRDAGISPDSDPDDPVAWFPSTESFARLLTADNRAMLRLIAEKSPGSLDELVELTGRAKSNLSRSLSTLASYGIVRMERHGRKVTPTVVYDRIELILPLTGRATPDAASFGDQT